MADFGRRRGWVRVLGRCALEQVPAKSQVRFLVAVSEKAVEAYTDESLGECVKQESADELGGVERQSATPIAPGIVFPAEGDFPIVDCLDPVI